MLRHTVTPTFTDVNVRRGQRSRCSEPSRVGQFFLSYHPSGEVLWQGRILSQPKPGLYLVQLYEWFLGEESDQLLIPLKQTRGWTLYPDADAWHEDIRRRTGAQPLEQKQADAEHPHILVFSPTSISKEQPNDI